MKAFLLFILELISASTQYTNLVEKHPTINPHYGEEN